MTSAISLLHSEVVAVTRLISPLHLNEGVYNEVKLKDGGVDMIRLSCVISSG